MIVITMLVQIVMICITRKCPKCINEIFISDDKSNDNTHEVAKKNGVQVFTNEKVNGYGGNVKNALNK